MFCQAGFDPWLTTLMQPLSPLSTPQATVWALWSCGMVLARWCALSAVSSLRAEGMQRSEQTGRQRLREWSDDVPRKRGAKRQALHVETCFPVLLGWVVSWWQGTQLALAIDATALGARFVVLAVSVVYRGWAIPVAWGVLPANTKHAWRREWRRRRRRQRPAVPRHWTVIVLADGGLYAPWLFRRMVRLGWHPFDAPQYGWQLSAHGGDLLAALGYLCAVSGHQRARDGYRLGAPPGSLHVAGALGRGVQRPLVDPDGSGAGGQ